MRDTIKQGDVLDLMVDGTAVVILQPTERAWHPDPHLVLVGPSTARYTEQDDGQITARVSPENKVEHR